MSLKQAAQNLGFRVLRLIGGLLLIYVSIVFYLALTERQNAYPRAITHKEAQAAIKATSKPLTCTLDDGIALEGWSIGDAQSPVFLYYPDANEDAAQFLAEVKDIPGINLVAFNYRGSGNNKGKPSTETFVPDAKQIAECASQVNGNKPRFLAGRGTGAILAAEQLGEGQTLFLIDPYLSIADAIAEKYRLLYPRFLIRDKEKIPEETIEKHKKSVILLQDSQNSCDRYHKVKQLFSLTKVDKRDKILLRNFVIKSLQSASSPAISRN